MRKTKRKTKILPYVFLAAFLLIFGLFVGRLLNSPIATHASANDSSQIPEIIPPGNVILNVPEVYKAPANTPTPTLPAPSLTPKTVDNSVPRHKVVVKHNEEKPTAPSHVAAPINDSPVIQAVPAQPPPSQPPLSLPSLAQAAQTSPEPSCSGSYAQQFLCLLNQYRVSQGKDALTYSSSLAAVALAHSSWMNNTKTFSHVGINGSLPEERCVTAGIVCHAENLSEGSPSPQNLLDMWKASHVHNKNLLGPYTIMGLGISGAYVTTLWN